MSLILNIDTSTEIAQVSIAKDGIVIKDMYNEEQRTHASFLQPAIKKILQDAGILITEIDAVAVTEGPGSYTGLRIGMSSAKGLCYALSKPMIIISTLEAMANTAIMKLQSHPIEKAELLCPMIDARRMEVFTAVYDLSLKNVLPPCAMILTHNSFEELLNEHRIIFLAAAVQNGKASPSIQMHLFYTQLSAPIALQNCLLKNLTTKIGGMFPTQNPHTLRNSRANNLINVKKNCNLTKKVDILDQQNGCLCNLLYLCGEV